MEQRLALLAADFAALYREVMKRHLLTPHGLTVDAFQAVFDQTHTEYLHYAGSSPTRPYHRDVVESVLQLAAAYLSLPPEASPHGRVFGMCLVFFLYATQPAIETEPVKVRVPLGTLQNYVEDAAPQQSVTATPRTVSSTQLRRRVTDVERRMLLALHQAGAWHVVPFDDVSVYVRTLLQVHEAEGVPLVTSTTVGHQQQPAKNALGNDATLSQKLEAYDSLKQRLGLGTALSWR
ncbi:small nuclear RNA activating protein 3 [Trypanosoma grayi]|uniref:small nuclear RNA activating protein 3 n=1 Tax=Trypanosoma grayi TaxID=71804 RepID=UPI0004F470E9|nr:small nuclear RNA activating protein 3 [Trypanosoma grayi]KEG07856.1 small nuclear RNA activating protein 3 [Trypanosoma grayi]